ncbi:MAG: OmpA family protein [Sphingomonadales bacterium]|nr:MAG: OmpA family protein [Sphingomonadales bacterium]
MKKLIMAAVLATTAMVSAAHAKDGAFYTGLKGGVTLFEDQGLQLLTPGDTPDVSEAFVLGNGTGFSISGVAGYDFGLFRTELELGYQRAQINEIEIDNAVAAEIGSERFPDGSVDGTTNVLSAMVNGLFDVVGDDESTWQGYVGGGVGIARVGQKGLRVNSTPALNFGSDNDSGFAWQLLGGLRRAISDAVDLTLEYKLFNATSLRLTQDIGAETRSNLRTHSVSIGFVYNFGAPAEAAPPPPPPPAPGPFIIFFDWNKADLTPEAQAVLERAADAYKSTGQASIVLQGHADRSGSDAYNQRISERRAAIAKAALAKLGITADAMKAEAFGESRPLVETADGAREPQNRRVEITLSK